MSQTASTPTCASASVGTIYPQVIGTPEVLDQKTDVKIYFAPLKNFFTANGITEGSKNQGNFANLDFGGSAQNFVQPVFTRRPRKSSCFESLSVILQNNYKPKKSYFVARHQFYLARQNNEENVARTCF